MNNPFDPSMTQIYKATRRWRTRHLLPLEMCVYAHLFVVSYAGGFGSGNLHAMLRAAKSDDDWFLVSGPIALAGFAVAIYEWFFGGGWNDLKLLHWTTLRKWLAFGGVFSWSYAWYSVITLPHGYQITSIIIGAPIMAIFAFWCWWVNYRTETLLDPRINTKRLEAKLDSERNSWH